MQGIGKGRVFDQQKAFAACKAYPFKYELCMRNDMMDHFQSVDVSFHLVRVIKHYLLISTNEKTSLCIRTCRYVLVILHLLKS